VLLDKLESGILRFETPHGLAAAEPTFWQRVYLLWTFRNFHQLSPLLLNPRQTALIDDLFRQHAMMDPQEFDPRLEIGIVENFVPPASETDTMPAARADASRSMKTKSPEQAAGQTVAPQNVLDRSFEPIVLWLRFAFSNLATFRLGASRQVMLKFAAAIGALSLCVYLAIAWHRIGAASDSRTHNAVPRLKTSPRSPSAPTPTPGSVNLTTEPESPPEAIPDQEAPDGPPPAEVASSITTADTTMTPERGSPVPAERVARSRGGSDAAAISRVPTSRSTRRLTLPPGSPGATARSAKRYFDLADRLLHEGNYAAAAANYKRAWRIEEHIAIAKGRQARARLAMQAKNESIANRR
jgi:hypothetical protein